MYINNNMGYRWDDFGRLFHGGVKLGISRGQILGDFFPGDVNDPKN